MVCDFLFVAHLCLWMWKGRGFEIGIIKINTKKNTNTLTHTQIYRCIYMNPEEHCEWY